MLYDQTLKAQIELSAKIKKTWLLTEQNDINRTEMDSTLLQSS